MANRWGNSGNSVRLYFLELKKIKSVTVSTCSPSIFCELMGPDAMILVYWMLSFKPEWKTLSFLPSSRDFLPLLVPWNLETSGLLLIPILLSCCTGHLGNFIYSHGFTYHVCKDFPKFMWILSPNISFCKRAPSLAISHIIILGISILIPSFLSPLM